MAYENIQLYRTLPKLSGNVKLDLKVEKVNDTWEVTGFHLRPISDLISYAIISDEYLLNSPHELNLRDFYTKTKGSFYEQVCDPLLSSDWPMILYKDQNTKYVKTWDDTYWSGTKRMQKSIYGTTHETLIPVWLEKVEESVKINVTFECTSVDYSQASSSIFSTITNSNVISLVLKRYDTPKTYHERFCNYFFDYLDHTGITVGNRNCMAIDFGNKTCSIYGLEIKSGNMVTRTDSNITNNLVTRERPLMEQNSIITNAYQDLGLILPQLINFNIVFDANEIGFGTSIVSTEVYVDLPEDATERESREYRLTKKDFCTNHHFISRPTINNELEENALDYLQDYKTTDLMHKDKISQSICHWAPLDGDFLFNVYDGFGSVYIKNDRKQFLQHCYGRIDDPLNEATNADTYNWIWNTNDINIDNESLEYESEYVTLSKYTGTIKFDEDVNLKVKLKAYEVDQESSYYEYIDEKGSLQGYLYDGESLRINIWQDRLDKVTKINYKGEETTEYISSLPAFDTLVRWLDIDEAYANSRYTESLFVDKYTASRNKDLSVWFDHMYDCTKYTDFNNLFNELLNNLDMDVSSEQPNFSKLEEILIEKEIEKDDDTTETVLIEKIEKTPLTSVLTIEYNDSGDVPQACFTCNYDKDSIIVPQLCLGNIIKSISTYVEYYKLKFEERSGCKYDELSPRGTWESWYGPFVNTLNKLDELNNELKKVQSPEVIYFNDSVSIYPDKRLDKKTKELTYYKKSNDNSYVLRYSDNIKPRFVESPNNYLWFKDAFKIADTPDAYKKYAYTNISPVFPSVDYDSYNTIGSYGYYTAYYEGLSSGTISLKHYNGVSNLINYEAPLRLFYGTNSNTSTKILELVDNGDNNIYYPYGDRVLSANTNKANILSTPFEDWWEEYSWFDKSVITVYSNYESNLAIFDNTKDDLENAIISDYQSYIVEDVYETYETMISTTTFTTHAINKPNLVYSTAQGLIPISAEYLRKIYNIEYDFQGIEYFSNYRRKTTSDGYRIVGDPKKTGSNYIVYKYIVRLTLK